MDEKGFSRKVRRDVEAAVKEFKRKYRDEAGAERITVETEQEIYNGIMFWSEDNNKADGWMLQFYKREADICIGLKVKGKEHGSKKEEEDWIVPIVLIEVKIGCQATSEFDCKARIYSRFKEVAPWVHTVLVHRDWTQEKWRRYDTFMRNNTGFDTIIHCYDERYGGKRILQDTIKNRLYYALVHWKL